MLIVAHVLHMCPPAHVLQVCPPPITTTMCRREVSYVVCVAGGEVGANIQRAQPTQTQICRETGREPIYKERERQRDFKRGRDR